MFVRCPVYTLLSISAYTSGIILYKHYWKLQSQSKIDNVIIIIIRHQIANAKILHP